MHPIFYFSILTILTPLYIPFLLLFTVLSNQTVTKTLKSLELFFHPLRIILLTPGVIKNHFITQTHWFRRNTKDSDSSVVLILGGNATTALKAYDDVYAKLEQDKKTKTDCACIPLQTHFTEKEYIDYLLAVAQSDILKNKDKISIYGHSLGGALSLQLAVELKKLNPNLQVDVFVSRSFDRLWHVSIYKYGKFFGRFFEKVFSGLWQLQSQKALEQLNALGVQVRVEQTEPDEILGKALLKPAQKENEKDFEWYESVDKSYIKPDYLHSLSQAHLIARKDSGYLKKIDRSSTQEPQGTLNKP